MKTSELTGAALNWAVAKCEDLTCEVFNGNIFLKPEHAVRSGNAMRIWHPSISWTQGGPIIEREDITWSMNMAPEHGDSTRYCAFSYRYGSSKATNGPTPLIAAMRCFVASKLGEHIDIPEELTP